MNLKSLLQAPLDDQKNINIPVSVCNAEKLFILCKPDMVTLHKRNELVSNCRHKRKFLPLDHFVGEPLKVLFVRYQVGL